MSRSARAIQRQAERDAEAIGRQIARAFQRAARAADRSTRNLSRGGGGGRSGGRMPIAGRARRAPGSSSQYHLHVKKSRASGATKSPVSSVNKVKYDLGLDEKDPHTDRVKIVLIDAPEGTPHPARNPLTMAAACETRAHQSKFANSHTGQMTHIDTALPNNLSADRLATLASDINKTISEQFKAPTFSGVHLDYGNFHIHSSLPLFEVHDDGRGGFYLGDRIDHAKRPDEREALGLPRQPAGELRELRQKIAHLIADSVAEELTDQPDREQAHHTAERWRHGHLTLGQQVEKAAARGDVQFVLDNLNRDATRKEGPRPHSGSFSKSDPKREQTEAYNAEAGKPITTPAPELITRTLVSRVVDLAQKAEIDTPEGFRMLARDHGLSVHWSAAKGGEGVQGVTFSVASGPRVAGQRAGASLGTLQKKLGWAERPTYRRFAPRKGDEWDAYQEKIKSAGIKPADANDRAIKITLERLAKLEAQVVAVSQEKAAPAATPVESAPTEGAQRVKPPKRERPKRKSNDPSFIRKTQMPAAAGRPTRGPVAPAKTTPSKEQSPMDVSDLLADLKTIKDDAPIEPVVVWKRPQPHAEQQSGVTAGKAKASSPLPDPATLTPHQRNILISEWDAREGRRQGGFDGPLTIARAQQDRLGEALRKKLKDEPWPTHEHRKRLLRAPILVETDEHKQWRTSLQEGQQKLKQLEQEIGKMIDRATNDPALLKSLSRLEKGADQEQAQRQHQQRRAEEREYERALERLEKARPDSADHAAALSIIKRVTHANPTLAEQEKQRRAQMAAASIQTQAHTPTTDDRRRQRQRGG